MHADQAGDLAQIRQRAQSGGSTAASLLDRDKYLFFPGDIFIREPGVSSSKLFEVWRCTKKFERCKKGRRCQVRGKRLKPEDEVGIQYVLESDAQEEVVLLGTIYLGFLVPVSETELAAAGTAENGDLRFKMDAAFHEEVVEFVEGAEAGPIEEAAEEEAIEPALLREQERLRRELERGFDFVASNLDRTQRSNRNVRHSFMDFARAAFAGHVPSSQAGY